MNKVFPSFFNCRILLICLLALCLSGGAFSQNTRSPGTPQDTQGIMTKVSQALVDGDINGALALFDTIAAPDSESPEIRLARASVMISAGNYDGARTLLNQILAGNPNNIDALLIQADIERFTGRDRELRRLLERIVKLDPGNQEALVTLGALSLEGRSYRTAANYFDRALRENAENQDALLGRAQVYRELNDPKNAESLLNRAISLYPTWAAAWSERGRLYRNAGFPEPALRDFDRALVLDPQNYWIAVDRGTTLIDLNRKPEALEQFERAKPLDPNNYLAYVYTAGIKDEFQDFEGAERDYTMISRLNPAYYFAFEGVGVHKMRQRDWAAAKDAFLAAYQQAPNAKEYAFLGAMNWMRSVNPRAPKDFLAQELKKVQRNSLEWYIFRLYQDLSGDTNLIAYIEKENNPDTKARGLFYLANFYDIMGNKNLAGTYFLQFREMNRMMILEWRFNEWALEDLGLGISAFPRESK